MSVTLYRNIALAVFVLVAVLACSIGEINQQFLVTLTPTSGKDILPIMTTLPTVVYPTLTLIPSSTPNPLPDITCDPNKINVICQATVCVVRYSPESGGDNIAYTVPHGVILPGATQCTCYACAEFEQNWFWWMDRDGQQFWAISMDQVWEKVQGE